MNKDIIDIEIFG